MANARRLFDELRRGANFAGLARQFSQSGTAILGGDLGWVQDGELEDQLNDVLAQMGPGEMSVPIRTLSGFHILLLRELRKNEGQEVDRARIQESLTNQRVDQLAQRSLQELRRAANVRSEEHTSELQSLMRISYAVFCLKTKNTNK